MLKMKVQNKRAYRTKIIRLYLKSDEYVIPLIGQWFLGHGPTNNGLCVEL